MKVNMNKIGAKEEPKKSRFYLDESENEWVDLRLLTRFQMDKIRVASGYTMRSEHKIIDGEPQQVTSFPDDEITMQDFIDSQLDYKIENWKIVDEDGAGKEIQCTKDNKLTLYKYNDEFRSFVDKSEEKLAKDENEKESEEVKN